METAANPSGYRGRMMLSDYRPRAGRFYLVALRAVKGPEPLRDFVSLQKVPFRHDVEL